MEEPKQKLPLRSIRLEALGDGIFAVAMTILVNSFLERELPDEVKKEAKISFLISPFVYAAVIIISFWFPVVTAVIF